MWNVICVKNQFLYVQLCKIMHDLFCKPGLDLIDQIMFFLSREIFTHKEASSITAEGVSNLETSDAGQGLCLWPFV